jgi:hypothetical protein
MGNMSKSLDIKISNPYNKHYYKPKETMRQIILSSYVKEKNVWIP